MNNSNEEPQKQYNLLLDSEPEDDQQDQQQQQNDEQFGFQLFQQERRQQILKQINQVEEDPRQQHQQLNEILGRKEKREQKQVKNKEQQQLKQLRQKNALQFFRKIKMIVILNFRDSMAQAYRASAYLYAQKFKVFSFFRIETLTLYQSLRSDHPKHIGRKQFIQFLQSIFKQSKLELGSANKKYMMIWALANSIQVGFRVLRFIDISSLQLESFYNLKYDQKKQRVKKGSQKSKKVIKKQKSKRSMSVQQLENIDLDSISQQLLQNSLSNFENETIKNQKQTLFEKTFRLSFCEIFCPVENNWKIFNMETLSIVQPDQLKSNILNKRAIIGFYSVRIINFRQQFKYLAKERNYGNLQLRDHTVDLCDKLDNLLKRRNRLGCKLLYRDIIRQADIFKTLNILKPFDKQIVEFNRKKLEQWAVDNFPKNVRQMRMSQQFVVPSLTEKYMVLREDAKPIPDLQFRQQKVYSKRDLVKVASRMGWIDQYRMVRQGQIPVKTTETMRKTTTMLYLFKQTQPFMFKFTDDGNFVLDQQYNSIYVPPTFSPPQGFILVPYNVDYICKKNKFKSARIVQGFDVAGWHIIPNNIGFLVQEKDKDEIERQYLQRQQKLKEKKEMKKEKDAIALWKKLFKSIIITQQV